MKQICPKPIAWNQAFKSLSSYAASHACSPAAPPKPLILAGWAYSNDEDKLLRWTETIIWARSNGCSQIVEDIPAHEFYFVENPSNYSVGPGGGPLYRPWDFESKPRPSTATINRYLEVLTSGWIGIVGEELGRVTRPHAFFGGKRRRLLVQANPDIEPPWGSWSKLSDEESERRAFTRFRAAINEAIAPHEVDHIDFTTVERDGASSKIYARAD